MNVLSLFDGMSCGKLALERAGIPITTYFASEVDKYAMEISKKNHPNIVQLGDVTKINVDLLPKIDILLGGSPCQGFSFAGTGLNFEDPRSKLFFEFSKIYQKLKEKNPDVKFLLENVKMKKESKDVISQHMGVEPVEICSSLMSAQMRKRLYWTNMGHINQPDDLGVFLKDVLMDDEAPKNDHTFMSEGTTKRFERYGVKFVDHTTPKARCLAAEEYVKNGRQGNYVLVHNIYGGFKEKKARVFEEKSPTIRTASGGGQLPSVFKGTKEEAQEMPLEELRTVIRKLHPIECERLQTLPDNYTEGVSNTQRYRMIGNGWTVDVVAHILNNINNKGE